MTLLQILNRFDDNIPNFAVLHFLDGIKLVVEKGLLSDSREKIRDKDGDFLADETFDSLY